jgi:hypothetical protein
MKQKLARLVLISLSLVLFSPAIASPLDQSLARPSLQTTPVTEWDEGLPVNSEDNSSNTINTSVATTAGTIYRTFSGTRFHPTSSSLTYTASGGAIYATALPSGGYSFSLDFDLPPGATITEVVFFVVDNDATNMSLSLRSYNPETNSFIILESGLSSGASSALQTIVITVDPPVQVDNTTTSYRLRVAPGVASNSHLLRGAHVGYTIQAAYLPLIAK